MPRPINPDSAFVRWQIDVSTPVALAFDEATRRLGLVKRKVITDLINQWVADNQPAPEKPAKQGKRK